MRSYIKIYGPPLFRAIKELERLSVKLPQMCVMDPIIASTPSLSGEEVLGYFGEMNLEPPISTERCGNIFSKHEAMLGEYDFFFEWFDDPTQSDINELIEKIDETFTPLGCKYTIVTKKR